MLKFMHKAFRLLIFVFLVISGACTRCPSQDEFKRPSSPKASWLVKFLEEPTCQPPCWENIIPGETTISDAMDLLRNVPYVQNISPYYLKPTSSVHIEWNFAGTPDIGRIYSTRDGEKVENIFLNLSGSSSLLLGDMIESYGPPSSLFTSLERQRCYCFTNIVYEHIGLSINFYHLCSHFSTGYGKYKIRIILAEETPIDGINLVPIGSELLTVNLSKDGMAWNGFDEYEFEKSYSGE